MSPRCEFAAHWAMPAPQKPKPGSKTKARTATSAASVARPLVTIAVIGAVIGVLVVVAAGVSSVVNPRSMFSGSQSKPQWVTPGEVRATTRDGTLVRLRVALDAPDSSTRSALESRLQQVGLLLEVSVAALSRSDLAGAEGLARLAHEMLQRLNAYLASEGVAPLKSVAIQDLWYTTR
ncbi:MAG: flagellar basal body-associated FliL family protein [Betaproteobacteria bacterium]|jgi:flagellar basal body-associated protein FliL|nr:MAG: flagellar basal body-associated FliL family protein [Betaproteobacteria bacterium]